jgi:hypothetical protein
MAWLASCPSFFSPYAVLPQPESVSRQMQAMAIAAFGIKCFPRLNGDSEHDAEKCERFSDDIML